MKRRMTNLEITPAEATRLLPEAELVLGIQWRKKKWGLIPSFNSMNLIETPVVMVEEMESDGDVVRVVVTVSSPQTHEETIVFTGGAWKRWKVDHLTIYFIQQDGWMHRLTTRPS